MGDDFVSMDFATTAPRDGYRLLTDLVIPRPIAFVSTVSGEGIPNLAPFSFFMLGGSNPPSVAFAPTVDRNIGEKDTLRNVRETEEFVINLVHRDVAEAMIRTSASVPAEIDEWELAGLTQLPSVRVRPARVAECDVQLECRLFTVLPHGDGPGAARYIVGEVLIAHVRSTPHPPIARLGGAGYLDLASGQTFDLIRP